MRFRASFFVSLLGVFALFTSPALAIINQVDGQIVPQTDALQSCLAGLGFSVTRDRGHIR